MTLCGALMSILTSWPLILLIAIDHIYNYLFIIS